MLRAITCLEDPKANLVGNCLPEDLAAYRLERFEEFLADCRKLMAQKVKQYHCAL